MKHRLVRAEKMSRASTALAQLTQNLNEPLFTSLIFILGYNAKYQQVIVSMFNSLHV